MHISINGETGAVDGRTRAYTEYRLFDTLRSVERQIRRVEVSLAASVRNARPAITCAIVLEHATGDRIEARATAEWPYAAIDAAVRHAWEQIEARTSEAVRA